MLRRFGRWLAPPVFEDEEVTRAARLLNTMLLTMVGGLVIAAVLIVGFYGMPTAAAGWMTMGLFVVTSAACLGLVFLMRRGQRFVKLVGWLFTSLLWAGATFTIAAFGGLPDVNTVAYFLVIVVAGLVLGGRALIILAALSLLATAAVYAAEMNGWLVFPPRVPEPFDLVAFTLVLGLTALLLRNAMRGLSHALELVRRNERALAESNRELQANRQMLEEHTQALERRARYLEATATIARDATAVQEVQQLLARVVTLVSQQLGYYHAGVFLLDSTREWAVLQAASSEGGQRMLARGHQLKLGQGIVGYAAEKGEPRIALDVGQDAVFFDNPDLPNTRSEMALPLRARGEIIGVLDVQSVESAAFSAEDVAVMQTLADQVAAAIDNARLFQQAQDSLEAERRAYGQSSRQAWREFVSSQRGLGFRRDRRGIVPIGGGWQAASPVPGHRTGQRAEQGAGTGLAVQAGSSMAMPIKVRDQIIGMVEVRRNNGGRAWSAEEAALLETLVDQLGPALDSARLFQETQRRAAYEQLASQVTSRMRESLDVETVLRTAVREIGEALGLHDLSIELALDAQSRDRGVEGLGQD